MKKIILYSCMAFFITTACVSQKEYTDLLNKYMNTQIEKSNLNKDNTSLQLQLETEKNNLDKTIAQLQKDSSELSTLIDNMKNNIDELNEEMTIKEKLNAEKIKSEKDLNQKTNAELIQMQLDLEKQKMALNQKEIEQKTLSKSLEERQQKINELEKILNDQKQKSEQLKDAIKKSLLDFNSTELNVYAKEGKVYVSMSDKLLFKSGSTFIDTKGVEALGKLAEVIKKNKDIDVNIEGHTDNVAYKGNEIIKDNLDLSLMRASSVTHILADKFKVNIKQIIPSGRGENFPIESNTTPEGKAKNRRTEIILSPKMDKILNLLQD